MTAPMPVVVGVPRSGTTLLRLMLDKHPDLAIPPETGFLPDLEALMGRPGVAVDTLLATIVGRDTWPDFGLEVDQLRAALVPDDPAGGARAFYWLYAERHGKPRWGEKTPTDAIEPIERLLPEARFVHLIRDGRDAAASLRGMWFAPSRDIAELASYWRRFLLRIRAGGARVRHYLEVRYEELVAEPETQLRRICEFIELPFDNSMLRYHETAAARLTEHQGRFDAAGREVLSREQRLGQQRNSMRPPDPSLIGRWRSALTADEQAQFERVAGDLLTQLGYLG